MTGEERNRPSPLAEWAEFVGDDVPDRALEERTLGTRVGGEEEERDREWPTAS